jgi:3-oxoacyl-[acyl-carrier-protein] synthase II
MALDRKRKRERRVVVTGLGPVTSVGIGVEPFWNALLSGKNGFGPITRFDATAYDTRIAAEITNFDPLQFMDRKSIQRMDLFTQFAMAAAELAVRDAEINFETLDRDRIGVIFGSGIGGMGTYFKQAQTVFELKRPDRISPFFVPMIISDIAAGYISIRYQVKGPNYATTSACATSAHAIGDGMMLIERGDADVMIVGGSEASITEMGVGGFTSMKAMSTRNNDPHHASRPFDKERDGFVIGEGGSVLILEELHHALQRGAKIYCELSGIGFTGDAFHITQPAPNGEGAVRSMKRCIEDAGLEPTDIDYINAHGTSTPFNDKTETQAIKHVFGEYAYRLLVSSTKSMTGHLLGAAGAMESIATVLAVQNDAVPPTINYEFPDPDCDLNYVPNQMQKKTVNAALSNAFGFGGHNATLCFEKYREQ